MKLFNSILVKSLFLLFLPIIGVSQNFKWVNQIGNNNIDGITKVINDLDDNLYVVGYFYGTLDVDPSSKTKHLISKGDADIYIAKFNADGNLIWAQSFGGSLEDVGYGLSLNNEGDLFVSGSFYNSVDFDPSDSNYNVSSKGASDVFLSKFDSSGNFIWVKTFGSVNYDYNRALNIDNSNNIYLPGTFTGSIDFDPGNGVEILTANSFDVFLVKLNSDGEFVWVNHLKSKYDSFVYGVVSDGNEACYISGFYSDSLLFDSKIEESNINSKGQHDVFIYKFNKDGKFIWNHSIGSPNEEQLQDIQIDNDNNLVFCGIFIDSLDFNPKGNNLSLNSKGGSDVFISKIDTSGLFIWAISFGSDKYDKCYSLSIDNQNNIYSIGVFYNTIDFNINGNKKIIAANGQVDIFINKIDNNGNYKGALSIGSTGPDYGSSVLIDNQNNLISSGDFAGTVDFDPGTGTLNLTSKGSSDAFILKLSSETLQTIQFIDDFTYYRLYPNPSNGELNLDIEGEFNLSIYNIYGDIVYTSSNRLNSLLNLESGPYLVKIEKNNTIYTSKIIINR